MGETASRDQLILLSGGLDSAAALYTTELDDRTRAMFIDYGQQTAPAEHPAAQRLAEHRGVQLEVVSVPLLSALGAGTLAGQAQAAAADGESPEQREEWFPARNLMLLTVAAVAVGRAGGGEIIFGTQTVAYRDTRTEFFRAAENALKEALPANQHVAVTVPSGTREEILAAAIANGLDVRLTFSCNRRADRHCWRCASCSDRREILQCLPAAR